MLESARALLGPVYPGPARWLLGKVLEFAMRITRLRDYDDYRLEDVHGMPILVLPSVANPKLLRTGAFFAACIDSRLVAPGSEVLDLGTGSGVCALFAARHAGRVVAVDINRAAIRCAGINAAMNHLERKIELRLGDLFAPVAGQRFDLVLFNPPFLLGVPKDDRDAAWKSSDAATRFAANLAQHLKANGAALLLLSSFGNACAMFVDELVARGYTLSVFARRRFINETVTVLRVVPPGAAS